MSSFFRHSLKLLRPSFSFSGNSTSHLRRAPSVIIPPVLESLGKSRTYLSESNVRSPFDSNIIRILRTEIQYQHDYGPPHQPPPSFKSFSVDERQGEQFIRLTHKIREKEDIKIEATMFDGCVTEPKPGVDADGEDIRLHISLLIDIFKGEESDGLGFVCSAWPDGLEIIKVYKLSRNGVQPKAYMGPNLRKLNPKLRKALHEYLEERGIDDELSFFLHHYMANKDRTELLRWLDTLKSFVEM